MKHAFKIQKAWVVFSSETDWPYLKFLKKGFRHCFVLINDGQHWVSLDPLLNHTEVQVHNVPPSFDLPGWLRGRGLTVIESPVDHAHRKPAPFMLFTCVEAVKRVLGLHAWHVLTPWQLYNHLTKTQPAVIPRAGAKSIVSSARADRRSPRTSRGMTTEEEYSFMSPAFIQTTAESVPWAA